jgi:hypothetical protein
MSAVLSHWLPSNRAVVAYRGHGRLGAVASVAADQQARADASIAFLQVFGRPPSRSEAQFAQAVGRLETVYGTTWHGDGVGSFNMGAVQSSLPPCDPAKSFLYTDTHPDGSSYAVCFKRYPNAAAGWADLIVQLYKKRPSVLKAAQAGDLHGVAVAMRETTYYGGHGATKAQQVAGYELAIKNNLKEITKALHEPMPSAGAAATTAGISATELGVALLVGVAAVKLLGKYRP